MVREMHLLSDTMTEADMNLKWTSTLSNNVKGNPKVPDRGIVRH